MSRIVRALTLMALLVGVASDDNSKETTTVPVITRKPRAVRSPQNAEVPLSAVGTGLRFKVKRQPPTTTAADKKASSHMGDAALQRSHISRTVNAVSTTMGGPSEAKRLFRPAGRLTNATKYISTRALEEKEIICIAVYSSAWPSYLSSPYQFLFFISFF